ncbi:hypothetical protein [Prochlorococcus marinus]|uniref:hypothetical protein n=1 Tax=Prochlorococcus marinus TaxID=1219 RepID=UPI0022B2FBEA|nr:hypothetical protein [Prochlorococcus marinus]
MDSANTVVDYTTDQEAIASIIEDSFPKDNTNQDLGNPQSDANRLGSRIFYLWVWPIVAINKIRNLFNRMDFVKPYEPGINDSYEVTDTETVYTMTKDAFAGEGGMKFMGLRFMSVWVFPMAILGTVIEFLFVGPLKGSNPFG